jgi:hypothetical protein
MSSGLIFLTLARTFMRITLLSAMTHCSRWVYKVLAFAVRDSALSKIVRGQLNSNAIPWHQTNEMFPHLASDVSYNLMAVLEFHPELSPGKRFDDCSRQLDYFFIRRHKYNKM